MCKYIFCIDECIHMYDMHKKYLENNLNDHSYVPPGQFIICRILHTLSILCSDFLPPGNPVRLTLNLVLYLGLELQILYCNYCNGHMGYKEKQKILLFLILERWFPWIYNKVRLTFSVQLVGCLKRESFQLKSTSPCLIILCQWSNSDKIE